MRSTITAYILYMYSISILWCTGKANLRVPVYPRTSSSWPVRWTTWMTGGRWGCGDGRLQSHGRLYTMGSKSTYNLITYNFSWSPQVANPQILGLIPLSQIYKFLRYDIDIDNSQISTQKIHMDRVSPMGLRTYLVPDGHRWRRWWAG